MSAVKSSKADTAQRERFVLKYFMERHFKGDVPPDNTHTCHKCTYWTMPGGYFNDDLKDIYVCTTGSLVHACGVKRCNQRFTFPTPDGDSVCRISGFIIGDSKHYVENYQTADRTHRKLDYNNNLTGDAVTTTVSKDVVKAKITARKKIIRKTIHIIMNQKILKNIERSKIDAFIDGAYNLYIRIYEPCKTNEHLIPYTAALATLCKKDIPCYHFNHVPWIRKALLPISDRSKKPEHRIRKQAKVNSEMMRAFQKETWRPWIIEFATFSKKNVI